MNEFTLIQRYFAKQNNHRDDVIVGIGDDAAIVTAPQKQQLVITTDTLIAGIHFPENTNPRDIGHQSLAVNLSDLAAMGATPAWVMLALTIPQADEEWLKAFCQGFFALAERYHIELIGGDLTHGPLVITVQALGFVPENKAILRSTAKVGDLIYVTGTLGDAGLALRIQAAGQQVNGYEKILTKLHRPEPRVEIGEQLRDLAHAAIDISDGLAADLGHLLEQSDVGAKVNVDQLPLSTALKQSVTPDEAIALALTAGDDYELCFTIPAEKKHELEKITSCPLTCIGVVTEQNGLDLRYGDDSKYHGPTQGYQHF